MPNTRSVVGRALLAAVVAVLPAAGARAQSLRTTTYTGCFAGIGCLTETNTLVLYGPFGLGPPANQYFDVIRAVGLQADFTSPHTALIPGLASVGEWPCTNGYAPSPGAFPVDPFACVTTFRVGAVNLQRFSYLSEFVRYGSPLLNPRWSGATRQVEVYTPIPGVEIPVDPNVDVRDYSTLQIVTLRTTSTPEPTSAALATTGLLALGLAGWRRRRAAAS